MKIVYRFIKTKIFLTLLLCFSSHAAFSNPYIGLQLGETNSHYNASRAGLMSVDSRNLGFSGRAYAGYAFNSLIGIEGGYLKFKDTRLKNMNNTGIAGKIQEHSWDALLKATWPFENGYTLFGRFGAAYANASPNKALRSLSTNDYRKNNVSHVRPIFGLGIAYQINTHLSVDASWLHLLKHRAIPEGDLVAIGLAYRFITEKAS